jgi:hypothetical protein
VANGVNAMEYAMQAASRERSIDCVIAHALLAHLRPTHYSVLTGGNGRQSTISSGVGKPRHPRISHTAIQLAPTQPCFSSLAPLWEDGNHDP